MRAQKLSEKREKLGPLEKKIKKLEDDIKVFEKKHEEITQKLIEASEKSDAEAIVKYSKKIKDLKDSIEKSYDSLGITLDEYETAKKDLND